MSKSKAGKGNKNYGTDRKQLILRLVLSDTCAVCKTPCARGMDYLNRMNTPGVVGKGVPCPLTKRLV